MMVNVDLIKAMVGRTVDLERDETSAPGQRLRFAAISLSDPGGAFRDISLAGERMPPKSTYFYPKLLSGLVINPLE